ncbi:hypothetical protein [Nostoc sp. LPT]|uniref:hypothetical protein n=1 Tax=Nostoc sp. LPT TaxID=2815387 RepID=UPI001E04F5F8|nr:hypothetical protein [Nostoc sp. LPT]MBN4004032.1 hypothetical protein [Nostoc sp. LPT]
MPIQIYWGEDEFLMHRAIGKLLKHILDRDWNCINYSEYSPSAQETIPQAFADVMTLPVRGRRRLSSQSQSALQLN